MGRLFWPLMIVPLVFLQGCLPSCRQGTGELRSMRVAEGFNSPLFLTSPAGDLARVFVVEQGGRIWILREGARLETPFLDISDRIADASGERGLLGLAFHPAYGENGHFFVNYTDENSNTNISRFTVSAGNPDVADAGSEVIVLEYDQPHANHNGGMLAFGPNDGYLYIAAGDGGSGNDPDNHGQRLNTLLGKILRIDVDGGPNGLIPEENPFAAGPAGARGEIWAYGLRNPWRFSFDRMTGDLWIADVGQSAREEVNFQAAGSSGGENYGWRIREGSICRPGEEASNCDLADRVDPIHDYDKTIAQSITGGYVYRGEMIPWLQGTYFFADYVSGEIWSLRYDGATVSEFTDRTGDLRPDGLLATVSSFGEDAAGELYIVAHNTGCIYKVVSGE